jgi:arginyl-tRNA--protein-N-Asp/Glu arginylyltransferase
MSHGTYRFELECEVIDLYELYSAAMHAALNQDKLSRSDAETVLNDTETGEINVGACIQMLLDPGSLTGCEVLESNCEQVQS